MLNSIKIMLIYYLLYIPFILCSILDTKELSKQRKEQICYFWVGILTLFWGLRWKCGTDWKQFHDDFYLLTFKNMFSFDRGMNEPLEFGYAFLNAFLHELGFSYTVFLLLFSFLILFIYAKFCLKYSSYPIMSFIYLVISLGVFFPGRQALATAIPLIGMKYVFEGSLKSFLKFMCFVVIASTIHTSALCTILFFPLARLKLSLKSLIIFIVALLVAIQYIPQFIEFALDHLTGIPLITVRLANYSNSVSSMGDDFSTRGLMSYSLTAFFLVSCIINKYYQSKDKTIRFYFNGLLTQESIRYAFAETMRDLLRLEAYFHPFSAVLICDFIGKGISKKGSFLLRIFFIILMAYYLYKMLNGVFMIAYVPYKTILFY